LVEISKREEVHVDDSEERDFCKGDLKQARPLRIPKHRWEDSIIMDFKEIGC